MARKEEGSKSSPKEAEEKKKAGYVLSINIVCKPKHCTAMTKLKKIISSSFPTSLKFPYYIRT